jgi:putative spermidine/putrescine transport system ATP-binding protein
MAEPPYLSLQRLEKRFGDGPPAVAGVDLEAARGEFLTLLGPSGCGKTTVLRMIAGLVPPTAGRITVAGADITAAPAHRRNMGLVFQSYALFPHLSITRNVAFGLEMRGLGKAATAKRVVEALRLVRLGELAHRMPRELSGGQQQRVALARALVIEPSLLLLDEPLSNLDAKLREELRDEIREIQRRIGITALFVTHDQTEALTLSDRVAVMNAGRIEQVGSPREIYERPATEFVAAFIGRTNRIAVRGAGGRLAVDGATALRAPAPLADGALATAMIRPHRIRLAAGGPGAEPASADGERNQVAALVVKVVFAGEIVQYELASGALRLAVEASTGSAGAAPFAVGDAVAASWDVADTMVFPA